MIVVKISTIFKKTLFRHCLCFEYTKQVVCFISSSCTLIRIILLLPMHSTSIRYFEIPSLHSLIWSIQNMEKAKACQFSKIC